MAIIGVIFSIVFWPFTNTLLKFIFGSQYLAAGDFFRIMLVALPIWFAAIAVNSALVSRRLAVDRLALQLIAIGAIVLTAFSANTEAGLAWLAWAILIGQSILLVGAVCLLVLRTRLQAA